MGSLLRAGIKPDACVLLEMASVVFRDIVDLEFEGYSLKDITLFASATVDPRLSSKFKQTIILLNLVSTTFAQFCLPAALQLSIRIILHSSCRDRIPGDNMLGLQPH